MKNLILDQLLQIDSMRSLLQKSEEAYWLFEIYNQKPDYSVEDLESLIRFSYINSLLGLSPETDNQYLDYSYKAFLSIDINDAKVSDIFNSIVGYESVDENLLYYFYIASLALRMNKTISARLVLKDFASFNIEYSANWKDRIITGILHSLILLIRKHNGFEDIRKALTVISNLQKEQEEFETDYLKTFQYREQTDEAFTLLSLYHTSKSVTETAMYLIQGYQYPRRIENVVRQHIDTALELLHGKENRLHDIVSFIFSDLKDLCNNSIWNGTAFQDKIKKLCTIKGNLGILELLPSQRNALSQKLLDVFANATVLQMPTSAGKTLLAEFNIIVTKSLRADAKIIYVVPSRALVNQVYYDLKSDLEELDFIIEKTSSAIEIDPTENDFLMGEKIDILVSTPEKLDLLIRRNHPSVSDVSLFIIDEAHTIQNGQRGARLELLMALLKREKPTSKFMLLSPFLKGDKGLLADWLGGGNTIQIDWKPSEKILLGLKVHQSKRTNKVEFQILPSTYSTSNTAIIENSFESPYRLESSTMKDQTLEFSMKHFASAGKTQLILCYGKGTANSRAEFIYNKIESCISSDEVDLVCKYMNDEIGKNTQFTKFLSKGIAVHHAGLSDEAKLLTEHLIRRKHIKYVCATTTIAEGVNFPVSTVFFDDYRRGSTNVLSSNDFWNIAGRAGRTLVDDFGKIILPFHSKDSILRAKEIISQGADEVASVLSELFIRNDEIRSMLRNDNGIDFLLNHYPDSFAPLFQYFVHVLTIGNNPYMDDVEELFKDSLQYHLLSTETDRRQFVDLCKAIYQSIEFKYNDRKGALSFADKTGFSVPSVLKIMREKSTNPEISDLSKWSSDELFSREDPSNLSEKIEVIASLKETELGTDSTIAPFSPELIAKMIIAWVKGDKLNDISLIHPALQSDNDEKRMSDFMKKMNDIRFKTSWGLSALEGIVRGNDIDIKDSYIPSLVYYGVDKEKPLALRMLGIPRSLSFSLSNIITGELKNYNYTKLRKQIKSLTNADWDSLKPGNSCLSGEEWKNIVEILMK